MLYLSPNNDLGQYVDHIWEVLIWAQDQKEGVSNVKCGFWSIFGSIEGMVWFRLLWRYFKARAFEKRENEPNFNPKKKERFLVWFETWNH